MVDIGAAEPPLSGGCIQGGGDSEARCGGLLENKLGRLLALMQFYWFVSVISCDDDYFASVVAVDYTCFDGDTIE